MTKTFKYISCNPTTKGKTVKKKSCMTPEVVDEIKNKYNKYNPDNLIRASKSIDVWSELKHKLNTCSTELCWLDEIKDPELNSKIKKKLFPPMRPHDWKSNPNTWLSDGDILQVLKQYEDAYNCFTFIGPTPIDYDYKETSVLGGNKKCVTEDLCKFILDEMITNKFSKIGIIFNLDKHDGPGTHWVSLFVNIKQKFIFYFDSNGVNPPFQIRKMINKIIEDGKSLKKPITFQTIINTFEHQKSDTECGMYSLYFIITLLTEKLKNKKMTIQQLKHHFLKKRVSDELVFKYRYKYFV